MGAADDFHKLEKRLECSRIGRCSVFGRIDNTKNNTIYCVLLAFYVFKVCRRPENSVPIFSKLRYYFGTFQNIPAETAHIPDKNARKPNQYFLKSEGIMGELCAWSAACIPASSLNGRTFCRQVNAGSIRPSVHPADNNTHGHIIFKSKT